MTRARTRTESHWHTQWRRRDAFLEEWRDNQRTVIRGANVVMEDTARRMRRGVYMGPDGPNPTRQLDAVRHELAGGTTSTVHRHSWDALLVPVRGSGWTEIDGRRYDWRSWDGLHVPAWSWHRHGNDGDTPVEFLSFSSYPLIATLNLAVLEEGGDTPVDQLPPPPQSAPRMEGTDSYARRVNELAHQEGLRRAARHHLDYDEHPLRPNPKGTRSKFLHDESVGMLTTGLTSVMLQFAPGYHQSMHRHPGEAWLFCIEGRGHSYLGEEPEGGEVHEWEAGDLVVVDHWLWHQHFNDVPDGPSRLIRIHMFASLLETMRAAMDPLTLFEEKLDTAPKLGEVDWPEDARPA